MSQPGSGDADQERQRQDELRRKRLARVEVAREPEDGNSGGREFAAAQSPPPVKRQNIASPQKVVPVTTTIASDLPIQSPSKLDMSARTLNMYLEDVLQATIRAESTPNPGVVLVQGDYGGLLQSSNFSAVVFERVSSDHSNSFQSAVHYLVSCYKRLVAKEPMIPEACREEFLSCKTQLMSFLVSCCVDPEIFAERSAHSVRDLLVLVQEDVSPVMPVLLREFIDELEKQDALQKVSTEVFGTCFAGLAPVVATAQPSTVFAGPPTLFSIFDNFRGPFKLLQAFLKDKRVGKCLVESPMFILSAQSTNNTSSALPKNIPQQYLHNPNFIMTHGRKGAALENHSLLGRILRLAPTLMDSRFIDTFKDTMKTPRNVFEGKVVEIRNSLQAVRSTGADVVLTLLKMGGVMKERALAWLFASLLDNVEATKDRPSPLLASSDGFLVNLSAVMLTLVAPILEDREKLKKVDFSFLQCVEGQSIFPTDLTRLCLPSAFGSGVVAEETAATTTQFTFVTQSFFLAWRALHIGVVPRCNRYVNLLRALNHHSDRLQNGDPQALQYLLMKISEDIQILSPTFVREVVMFCAAASERMLSFLEPDETYQRCVVNGRSWLLPPSEFSAEQRRQLLQLPENLLDDLATMLLFVARASPANIRDAPMDAVLSLIVYFLRRPWAIQSPHLRAKLGQLLYSVFLPVAERGHEEMYTHQKSVDGAHTQLLAHHLGAQRFLAPALLLLYGDVERTGFYEKFSNRRSIMIVLKHLWTLPSHRPAFQGIALLDDSSINSSSNSSNNNSSSGDSANSGNNNSNNPSSGAGGGSGGGDMGRTSFVRFANGLLNETNALVATTLDKLAEIRKVQLQKQNVPEWSRLSEEERKQIDERHESNEMECRGSAGLCLETLNMLNYLTSDPVIREPFLLDEILPRFTSCLLNVLQRLVGGRSLELKVENMESYHFQPSQMLQEVISAMVHFHDQEKFWRSVAQDSFYNNGVPLQKALATVSKHNLATAEEKLMMAQLVDGVRNSRSGIVDLEQLAAEAPDEFRDPILDVLMRDPVLLPTSDMIVDRATIAQHLLNNEIDPFNRKPLRLDMVQPQTELKERINAWIEEKLQSSA